MADGANISQGRNIAYKNAKYDVVASVDGGVVLDKNWLKNILKNIEKGYDVSAGYFVARPQNEFEEVVDRLLYPRMEEMPEDWCPSSRSAVYRKKVWEKVGGYPEQLYTAEDAVFNHRAKDLGFKYKIARDAVAYWKPRVGFRRLFKQYFIYAQGNGQSLLGFTRYPENRRTYMFYALILFLILTYFMNPFIPLIIILLIPALGFIYGYNIFGDLEKAHTANKILMLTAIANFLGVHNGLFRKLAGKVKPQKIKSIKVIK